MNGNTEPTTREASRLAVRRLTRVLAALAVAATAAFGAAAASATKHGTTAGEQSVDVVDAASWDDGYGAYDRYGGFGLAPPSQGVTSGDGGPLATSGGS